MRKGLLIVISLLLLTLPGISLAQEDGGSDRGREENEIEIEDEEEKVEIQGNQFEIRGEITSISDNGFTVAGQNIVVDPTQVREFEQRGVLEVGKTVKVEGPIINGNKFAREITVIGEAEEETKIEVKNVPGERPEVEVKAKGPIDQLNELIQQILAFLRGTNR